MDTKLTEKICTNILINSVHVGQKNGSFTIKDASILFKALTFLKEENPPKDTENDKKIQYFDTLIKATIIANSKGSYTIEEAALIDRVVTELQSYGLATSPEKPRASEKKESTKFGTITDL